MMYGVNGKRRRRVYTDQRGRQEGQSREGGESEDIQINGAACGGRYGDNREMRSRGYTDQRGRWGRQYGDNRERRSRGYTAKKEREEAETI